MGRRKEEEERGARKQEEGEMSGGRVREGGE